MPGKPPTLRTYHSPNQRPAHPSSLRNAQQAPVSEDSQYDNDDGPSSRRAGGRASGSLDTVLSASESTPLMADTGTSGRRSKSHPAHEGICSHGTFSPRASSPVDPSGRRSHDDEDDNASSVESGTGIAALDSAVTHIVGHNGWKRWLKSRVRTKKMGRSSELAEQAGIQDSHLM